MTTALDLALSVSVASYARPEPLPEGTVLSTQRLVKVDRPVKGRKISAAKPAPQSVEAAPKSAPKPAAPSPNGGKPAVELPPAGTIGAKAFLMGMNRAKDRDEKIILIAAFIGYDGRQNYGEQEARALSQAKGEIRPVSAEGPTRAELRAAQRSAIGYVSGMPDALKRTVQDLIGREQLAVDTRNEHVRDARNHERPIAQRKLSIGLARLEQERLVQIRADLAKYVG